QPVSGAIRTVVFSEARSDSTGTGLRDDAISDAVGPRVIPEDREALGATSLDRQQHGVVTAGAAIFQIANSVVIRSLAWIQQRQDFPLSDVTRVRPGLIQRVIHLDLRSPQVNILVPQIIRGQQPVLSHLSLNAQVPLVNVCGFGVLPEIVIAAIEL